MSKSTTFHFKHFSIDQEHCAMKVGIDSVLLGAWCPAEDAAHLLDIGTGTGILALMLAQRTSAIIDAVEIDKQAHKQARENIHNSPFHQRISIHHSAIQHFKPQKLYDHIISNPPYFNNSLKANTEARTAARHTDHLSFEELFSCATALLKPEGQLSLILPHNTLDEIIAIASAQQMHLADQVNIAGKEEKQPNRALLNFCRTKKELKISPLNVYNKDGKYSDEFKQLTQDFYLDSIFR